MFVLSILKKTAHPTEYYFDTFEGAEIAQNYFKEGSLDLIYISDDYGQNAYINMKEIAEIIITDVKRKKMVIHELKMIEEYAKIEINKLTLADPRTADILQQQQPINSNAH